MWASEHAKVKTLPCRAFLAGISCRKFWSCRAFPAALPEIVFVDVRLHHCQWQAVPLA